MGQFLHANYRALSERHLSLQGAGRPDDVVLISEGPGLEPDQPVLGGAQDLQVLAYDPLAKRWNQAFDAADHVVTSEFLPPATGSVPSEAQPLLEQDHRIEQVAAWPASFGAGSPDLVVYGVDGTPNHPPGLLAAISFAQGTATLEYFDREAGMGAPRIGGAPGAQRLTITAEDFTPSDPACCPAREYTQVIGQLGGGAAAVGVVADDRPWLGAYATSVLGDPAGPVVVVGVADGSPASAVLHVADRITAVLGTPAPTGAGLGSAVYDEIALHHPGDQVTLQVTRGGTALQIPVTLGSRLSSAYSTVVPEPALIGASADDAPAGTTPGAVIVSVVAGDPAAQAGLAPGDEITAVGPVPVDSAFDLQVALMGHADQSVELAVRHVDGTSATIPVTPRPAGPQDTGVVAAYPM